MKYAGKIERRKPLSQNECREATHSPAIALYACTESTPVCKQKVKVMSSNVIGFPKDCGKVCCITNDCDEFRKERGKCVPLIKK